MITIKATIGMKGFLRLRTRNVFSGKITQDTGWFPNTILDAGRNIMADRSDWMTWCQVGTDGTFPPTLAQRQAETALGNHYAGTDNDIDTSSGLSGVAPYYGWKNRTWRFLQGTFPGGVNLSEAGVGWGETGSTLISRAPILDPILQTPTTVSPQVDEFLEVLYELRYYSPSVDVILPQITLDGTVYDTTVRAANVTSSVWSDSIGSAIGVVPGAAIWSAWDGTIGTILTGPNGSSIGCDTSGQYNTAYSANSYERQLNCPVGSLGWNFGTPGIRSILIRTTAGEYQTQFDANPGGTPIPKTSAYSMLMSWIISWAEYIAPWELALAPYALGDRVTHNDLQWESDITNNSSEPGVADWTLF